MVQTTKGAIEAVLNRTGLTLRNTEIDQMTEIEQLDLLFKLMEFAKNVESTMYYGSMNQQFRNIKKESVNGKESV